MLLHFICTGGASLLHCWCSSFSRKVHWPPLRSVSQRWIQWMDIGTVWLWHIMMSKGGTGLDQEKVIQQRHVYAQRIAENCSQFIKSRKYEQLLNTNKWFRVARWLNEHFVEKLASNNEIWKVRIKCYEIAFNSAPPTSMLQQSSNAPLSNANVSDLSEPPLFCLSHT